MIDGGGCKTVNDVTFLRCRKLPRECPPQTLPCTAAKFYYLSTIDYKCVRYFCATCFISENASMRINSSSTLNNKAKIRSVSNHTFTFLCLSGKNSTFLAYDKESNSLNRSRTIRPPGNLTLLRRNGLRYFYRCRRRTSRRDHLFLAY